VTVDHSNFLESLIALLDEHGIRYCVIAGQGVNAYVEPLVSLDLDLVIAVEQLTQAEALLKSRYDVERFPLSLNISAAGSELRVQLQTDPRLFRIREALDRARRSGHLAAGGQLGRCPARQGLGRIGPGQASQQAPQGSARHRTHRRKLSTSA
jgi:hypothetical protein